MKFIIKTKKKSFTDSVKELRKSLDCEVMEKGRAYPIGTIREWKGEKYIKTAQGWKPKTDGRQPGKTEDKKTNTTNTTENQDIKISKVGDIVEFTTDKGNKIKGEVVAVGQDGVQVKNEGVVYKVRHENIESSVSKNVEILMDKTFVQSGWRNGSDGLQPKSFDTIEGLYKGVEAVQKEFNDLSESVKEQFKELNPLLLKRTSLKGVDRVKEKLREDAKDSLTKAREAGDLNFKPKEYDEKTDTYHCRTIRDCDGHTFCMNSLEDVSKVMQFYNKQGYVVRMKNNFAKPSPVGYSDINMNIKLSNGAIVEMQLNTTANMVAKERYGHSLYEVYRSVGSNPKYNELKDLMSKAQESLYGLANQHSKNGNFPEVPNGNIFAKEYKYQPYADSIKDYVEKALPMFEQAKKDGVLNKKTIEHFEHLVSYIK